MFICALPFYLVFVHLITFDIVVPWCSGYHYCATSFSKVWSQVLRRFKSCSRRVGDSRWWGSLTMVPVGNKARRLWSVNHTTKTIPSSSSSHHHHHHSLYEWMFLSWKSGKICKFVTLNRSPKSTKGWFWNIHR